MRYATALLLALVLCGCNRPKPQPVQATVGTWYKLVYGPPNLDYPAVIERQVGEGWAQICGASWKETGEIETYLCPNPSATPVESPRPR
jgi:hypothetical protein